MPVKVDESGHADDIVISGISGMFPKSKNMTEFKKNLFSKEDMISAVDRWDLEQKERKRIGEIKNADRFDNSFFHVNDHEAEQMSNSARLLLEKSFEAIMDAGYNPIKMKRKNIAVVCGISEGLKEESRTSEKLVGKITTPKSQTANIISYWLDVTGPSITLDTACSSSMIAIDLAMKAIQSGECEGALVCSSHFCYLPGDEYYNVGIISPTGVCRPFDADGDGFTRAEAAIVVFLQPQKHARRIYAKVVDCAINSDGFKEEGLTCPSIKLQKALYEKLYEKNGIDLASIYYLEAHGTGTKVGDVIEGTSIEEFFCANRKTSLKIGSVKSNMGHSEAPAALCSLAKMIISFEDGRIPAHINYENPNPKIKGLHNGLLEVTTEHTSLHGKYVSISSFGVGGVNGHILLSRHNKIKTKYNHEANHLPKLVTVSGRTEKAINNILNDLEKNYEDVEYIRLFHEIFSDNIDDYDHRGFIILNENGNHIKSKKILAGKQPPIMFVFSGIGSQWYSVGEPLMKIPVFAESIQTAQKILKPKGINLIEIITTNDPKITANVLNSLIGIVTIQVALVDVLKVLNITPHIILGHSIGELGCAYADGCLTAEQTILAAYYYGLLLLHHELIRCTIVTIGSSYRVVESLIPPEIDIVSHNGPDSCTISGPSDIVQEFTETLSQKNIPIQEIQTLNRPYNIRNQTNAISKLTSNLKEIITEPKLRSHKWLSTSSPSHELGSIKTQYCSIEYLTNTLLNPVYFEETCRHVPSNVVAIKLASCDVINRALKSSLASSVKYVSLTAKNCENGEERFLKALGQLYEAGYALKLDSLYPPIEFPVSRSTPMISPLIKWKHNRRWTIGQCKYGNSLSMVQDVIINPKAGTLEYITGHVVDERNLYPGLGYLALVWETVCLMMNKKRNSIPIVFENARFERATNIPKNGTVKLRVSVNLAAQIFEITETGALVAFGKVRIPNDITKEKMDVQPFVDDISNDKILPLNMKNFYKELRLRGYHYKGLFKNVVYANATGTYGKVSWCNNFVSFMDSMAQIAILHADCRELLVPTSLRKVIIDVGKHHEVLRTLDEKNPEFSVNFYPHLGLICSGGVQMTGFKTNEIARKPDKADPVLERHQFTPYISDEEMNLNSAVRLCVQIALENSPSVQVKTYEILDQEYDENAPLISSAIAETLADLPLIRASVNVLDMCKKLTESESPTGVTILNEDLPQNADSLLIVLSNIRDKADLFEQVFKALKSGGFVLTRESNNEKNSFDDLGFNTCFCRSVNANEKILLLNKATQIEINTASVINIQNDSLSWISKVQNTLTNMKVESEKLVLYAEKEPASGILGLFNCLRKEEKGLATRCFFIMDENAPTFSLKDPLYKSQFNNNLSQNVYKNGQWGSYRHLLLEPVQEIEAVHAFCMPEKRADLSSFRWLEDSLNPTTYKNSEEKFLLYVYYSSLNFRDVLLSAGRISTSDYLLFTRLSEGVQGGECSGKDENGRRLMGLVGLKGIATLVEMSPHLCWEVPDNMTLEEAATIPTIYSTVIYALFLRMNLKKGASILIHAGSGGIGQAAINICLHYECNIFTSVGTPEKVEFIRKTYPQIPESHICNSRNTTFEKIIMEQTNGKGVDVVLNSLSEDKLKASLRCLAKGGNFLEIGKFDMAMNNHLEMRHFLADITFHSIQLDVVIAQSKRTTALRDKMQEMLSKGIVKPINRTVFQADEVESAFRYMAAGKHIGKVIIKIRDEEVDLRAEPSLVHMKAKPRVLCHQDRSYVIIGGLGGFGLELVDWLILRGARNIVLSSRTGIKNGYQSYRIKLWRSYGVNVVTISTEDVTTENGVYNLLQTANGLGPIAGIFNVALILKDDPFSKQNEDTFSTVAGPKAIATVHLDKLSRTMCPYLEHFVVFSSVSCGRGNFDQTNYGFANSIMERICESRKADNLPALAIQWGAIGEVGIVADFAEDNLSIVIGGTLQQNVRSCLKSLNTFMTQSNPVVASMIVAEKRQGDSDVIGAIANILGIKDFKTISLNWTLPELGMDSISGVEIKQILESEFNTFFTPGDLRTMTFTKLYRLKEDKKNSSEPDKKTIPQYIQLGMDMKTLKEPILRIPFNDGEISGELSTNDNPILFALPGVEGVASLLEPLATNLPVQVLCFQYYEKDFPISSNTEAGHYFSKFILEKLTSDQEFIVVGYSLGGLFALDTVRVLEEQGKKGYLYLIDSSPAFLAKTAAGMLKREDSESDKNLQNHVCISILKIVSTEMATDEYFDYIEKAQDWESKKKIIISITSRLSLNDEAIDQVLDKCYTLLKTVPKYVYNHDPLRTPCTLIRTTENLYNLDESYGLQEIFSNTVQVHCIEEDHYNILKNTRTAEIIMECPIWRKN